MVTNIPWATQRRVIVLNVQALVFTIITIAKNFKGNALRVTAKVGCLIVTTHAPNLITTNPLNNNPRVVVKDMFNYIMEQTIMAHSNVQLVRDLMLSALFGESQESVEPKLMQKLDKVAKSSTNWNSTIITKDNIKAIQEYGYNDIKVGDKVYRYKRPITVTKDGVGSTTITVKAKANSIRAIARHDKNLNKTFTNKIVIV